MDKYDELLETLEAMTMESAEHRDLMEHVTKNKDEEVLELARMVPELRTVLILNMEIGRKRGHAQGMAEAFSIALALVKAAKEES